MKITTPKTGLKGLKNHWKDDLKAGYSVSLIALPLCLGISIASGFPPVAGILTAIVGGLLVSRIGGSFVTINGPAAGLIVISLGAATNLGGAGEAAGFAGYPHALGAIVIAGLFIMLFGLLKVGKLGDFFPSAAVHGMLAAIGIIIIIKQVYDAFGIKSTSKGIINQLIEIPTRLPDINSSAAIVAGVSLATLIIHPLVKIKLVKAIPAPMWVLIFAIPLGMLLDMDSKLLVNLPDNLSESITLPSFEKIGESAFWVGVTGFALVSAIESLLSALAVDSQDPYNRKTNLDKDLVGVGAGSSISAMIGGLPMIAEIVRSSANINNGAKTSWANFFHGTFLLLFLLIGTSVIELIPVAALAAMLLFTGYRLASPKEFKRMAKIGKGQLLIFLTTIITVLFTNLLMGIAAGIVLKIIIHIIYGTQINNLFIAKINDTKGEDELTIQPKGALIFSNYLSFKSKVLNLVDSPKSILLDFSNVDLVDHTFQTHLIGLIKNWEAKGIKVDKINLEHMRSISSHDTSPKIKIKGQ